jgi:hypothetical protein
MSSRGHRVFVDEAVEIFGRWMCVPVILAGGGGMGAGRGGCPSGGAWGPAPGAIPRSASLSASTCGGSGLRTDHRVASLRGGARRS